MSEQAIKLLIAAVLLLHGLGHGGAIGALAWVGYRPEMDSGGWKAARSWLFPSLPGRAATIIASVFWLLSLVGFVAAALSFSGFLLPVAVWSQLALSSALISTLGIVLFLGTWPAFNTLAALVVNVVVLVTQL